MFISAYVWLVPSTPSTLNETSKYLNIFVEEGHVGTCSRVVKQNQTIILIGWYACMSVHKSNTEFIPCKVTNISMSGSHTGSQEEFGGNPRPKYNTPCRFGSQSHFRRLESVENTFIGHAVTSEFFLN